MASTRCSVFGAGRMLKVMREADGFAVVRMLIWCSGERY